MVSGDAINDIKTTERGSTIGNNLRHACVTKLKGVSITQATHLVSILQRVWLMLRPCFYAAGTAQQGSQGKCYHTTTPEIKMYPCENCTVRAASCQA